MTKPLSQITFGADYNGTPGLKFDDLVTKLKTNAPAKKPRKSDYTNEELQELKRSITNTLHIAVTPRGIIKAADYGAKLHYDAVWIRDSLWAYLATKNVKILKAMLDSISTGTQLKRLNDAIENPDIIHNPQGRMLAPHIRFDAHSPTFDDVTVNEKPQSWNHKQNDALGLLLDLTLRALKTNVLTKAELSTGNLAALKLLPVYFRKIKFHEMEDAGSWEEIERVNTSSIALVTSALEQLEETKENNNLINQGYERIFAQLNAGGESPLYPASSPRFRTADAALLNLIYPAKLKKLTLLHKQKIIEIIQPLIGPTGIKRYINDSYQSGNFWYQQLDTLVNDANGTDTQSAHEFREREKQFIPGTEAQWFFDSWLSLAYKIMEQETGSAEFRVKRFAHLNRALDQITSPENTIGADGHPVPPNALPESYNTIVANDGTRLVAPSPVTPLNWAKAGLALALSTI